MDNYLQELLYMLLALVLVVAMAWLLLKVLKGFYVKQGDGNRIKLLLTLPVGSRERVVVVAYRECEYLVGITQGGMALLDKLPVGEMEGSSGVEEEEPESRRSD